LDPEVAIGSGIGNGFGIFGGKMKAKIVDRKIYLPKDLLEEGACPRGVRVRLLLWATRSG